MAHTDEHMRPGSEEAGAAGCSCPIIDNHFGAGRSDGTYVYSGDCELHKALIQKAQQQ